MKRALTWTLCSVLAAGGLSCSSSPVAGADAGGPGSDGGRASDGGADAGTFDGGLSTDAGPSNDAGSSTDAGPADGGRLPDGGCGPALSPCGGSCVYESNDILNCGGCGIVCGGANPYCDNGVCGQPPCNGASCVSGQFCCDTQCCQTGELCCQVPSGIAAGPKCTAPVNGTCPIGCPLCP